MCACDDARALRDGKGAGEDSERLAVRDRHRRQRGVSGSHGGGLVWVAAHARPIDAVLVDLSNSSFPLETHRFNENRRKMAIFMYTHTLQMSSPSSAQRAHSLLLAQ